MGPIIKPGPKHSWCTSYSAQYLKLSQCNDICSDIQLYHYGRNFWFRQCLQLHHEKLLRGVQILICSIKKNFLNIFQEEVSWNRRHHCTIKITGCNIIKILAFMQWKILYGTNQNHLLFWHRACTTYISVTYIMVFRNCLL